MTRGGSLLALLFLGLWTGTADAQNTMQVSSTSTTPGGNATVEVLLTHDANVQGFQTAMTWDSTLLTNIAIDYVGMDVQALLLPATIEFFTTNVDPALSPGVGWGAAAAIFDFSTPFDAQVLPPGVDQSLVFYQFSTAADPLLVGTSTDLTLQNGLSSPPIFNVITVGGSSVLPTLLPGTITFVDLPLFKRGDSNGDGSVNLADAIFLIQFLFNQSTAPPCSEAGDANDDMLLDVSDAIYEINFFFLDGLAPPAPFPNCGTDPDGTNGLPCTNYTAC